MIGHRSLQAVPDFPQPGFFSVSPETMQTKNDKNTSNKHYYQLNAECRSTCLQKTIKPMILLKLNNLQYVNIDFLLFNLMNLDCSLTPLSVKVRLKRW